MKNIVLFIIGIWFLGLNELNAQSIKVYYDNDEVTNDSVYINGTPDYFLVTCHLSVQNTTDKDIDVKVRKTELLLVENSVNYFCWGACFTSTVYVSPIEVNIPAESTDTISFIGDYLPNGATETSVIRYTFFLSDNEGDTASVTVFYQMLSSGIQHYALDQDLLHIYPNPVSSELNIRYNLIRNRIFAVNLINVDGKVIKSVLLQSGESGLKWNLSELPGGYYILEFRNDTNCVLRKKILVLH